MPFPFAEYERMAEVMRGMQGRALVSLNDHPDSRLVFDGFHIESTEITYTVARDARKAPGKVLIFGWDVQAEPVGLS